MLRIIIITIVFLLSLLTVLPIPARQLWYAAIAVDSYPWIFVIMSLLLLFLNSYAKRYKLLGTILCVFSCALFLSPVVRAYTLSKELDKQLDAAFGSQSGVATTTHRNTAFSFSNLFGTNKPEKIDPHTYTYTQHGGVDLDLNFYPANKKGLRPCIIVVHGGSWQKGSNAELPEVNNYFANEGYHVASINYRLAPE